MNQPVVFLRHLRAMLAIAEVIVRGARARDENRGAHYKPEFDPESKSAVAGAKGRDDERWLKTTIAEFTPDGPKFSYQPVDVSLVRPRARVYKKAGAASAPTPSTAPPEPASAAPPERAN
jgi:succinate dehydrogenase / fumarate reductase flavoprotein subunit